MLHGPSAPHERCVFMCLLTHTQARGATALVTHYLFIWWPLFFVTSNTGSSTSKKKKKDFAPANITNHISFQSDKLKKHKCVMYHSDAIIHHLT